MIKTLVSVFGDLKLYESNFRVNHTLSYFIFKCFNKIKTILFEIKVLLC